MPPDGNPKGRGDEDTIASADPYWRRRIHTLQAEKERLREAATMAERIVAHGCPTGAGRCIYCNRKIVSTGAEYGLQAHRDDCAWPPFKKAFS